MKAPQGSAAMTPARARWRMAGRVWLAGLCVLALAGTRLVTPLAAQDAAGVGGAAVEAQDVDASAGVEAVASGPADPLPRPIAPRSLRPYWHVFAAFGIAWLLLFGYGALLSRRLDAIERDVIRLRGNGPGS